MKTLTKISDTNYKLKGKSHPFFGNQHTRIMRKSQRGEISAKTMIKLGLLVTVILVAIIAALLTKKPSKMKLLNPCPPYGCINLAPVTKVYAAEIKTTITYGATPTPTPVLSPKSNQNQEVKGYIEEVFGADAPKAFKLLSCENSTYDPSRVNTYGNYPVGSRDIGSFMINEYWQKVPAKFLFNYKINVQIAYQLYMENGKSFKMWACGKRMGI